MALHKSISLAKPLPQVSSSDKLMPLIGRDFMRDLQQRIATLRQRIEAGSEDHSSLEQEARALLSEAKNTVYEADAQAIFAELAQRSRGEEVNNPQLRGLVRRARIRIEMAGDEDDIDEAIDILTEAVANYPADREVIALLQEAADKTPH